MNLAFAELATQCFSPRLHPITAAMAKLRGRCANTAASVQRYCQYQYRCFRAAGALAGWCLREGWNLQVDLAPPLRRALLQDLSPPSEPLQDLAAIDPELHKGLLDLRSLDAATLADLELSFVYTEGGTETEGGTVIDLRKS